MLFSLTQEDDVVITPIIFNREDQAITPQIKQNTIPIDLTPTPTPTPKRKTSSYPLFPLGGGGGGGGRGGFDSLTGKWYKYKNPVKTPKQMLKDFSTFGSTKNTKKQSFGNFGFNTKAFKANPILSFNPAKGNKRQKSPFGNFAVNTRNNPILNFNLQNKRKTKVLKDFESFGGKSRFSISTPKFKQPRINYNLSKQRRKRKR